MIFVSTFLIFQITIIGIYYFLIFNFIKNIKTNRIIILSILTPIFLLYPVAEIEVLARKEFFIFCIFICYLFLDNSKKRNIFKIFFLPLAVLIWEPVVFYFIFFLALDIVQDELKKIDKKIFVNLLTYIPALIIAIHIALNPISEDNHQLMADYLKIILTKNVICPALLKSKASLYQQFQVILISIRL